MLRFVMNTAPLAISTTGRGSSGVGLTAAMIRDTATRDFQLEAGAMVLADRGVICIDEFDKMTHNDRVSIHEAMEQQCVTIAKAGMHVTLNARCSVTAAANPKYGNFDPTLTLADNIGLPDSLLSRFDLVYVVRDLTTEEIDRRIATQVLRQASQRLTSERRGVEHMHSNILERRQEVDQRKTQEATQVFQKGVPRGDGEEAPEVLTVDFLRKYLRYCRRLAPKLNEASQAAVAEKYVDMRMRFQSGFNDQQNPDTKRKPRLAVTTRTLEALIRLATAHAKLRLRKDEVLPEDVQEAYKLMLQAREEDVPELPAAAAEAPPDEDGGDEPGAEQRGVKRTSEEAGLADVAASSISQGRLRNMRTLVARSFARLGEQTVKRGDLLEAINASLTEGEAAFTEEEFDAGIDRLEADNKVMSVVETGDIIQVE
jgi:DNA replication licensing factor MCM3